MKLAVVTYMGRCGSSWLGRFFGTSPHVVNHEESFNLTDHRRLPPVFGIKEATERLLSVYEPGKINLFKILSHQLPCIPELIDQFFDHVMILHRPNFLAQYSSQKIAMETRTWFTAEPREQTRIRFYHVDFSRHHNYSTHWYTMMDRVYPDIPRLSYESLYQQASELGKDFGLNLDVNSIETFSTRTNSQDIVDRFDRQDHSLLLRTLDRMKHPEWVTETTDIPG